MYLYVFVVVVAFSLKEMCVDGFFDGFQRLSDLISRSQWPEGPRSGGNSTRSCLESSSPDLAIPNDFENHLESL